MTTRSPDHRVAASTRNHDVENGNEKTCPDNTNLTQRIDKSIYEGTHVTSDGAEVSELDPSLPLNWSAGKKFFNMAIPSILCFVVAFGSSVYTPAIPDVMLDFRVSNTIATVPLTTYVLGLSFGPMVSAPISETLGRMGIYHIAVPISALFTVGSAFSPNITALCILRFFAGIFGGAPLSVCAGTSADLFRPKERAVAGTLLLYVCFLGPAIGPVVGGFVTQHNGWAWSLHTLAIIMGATYIPAVFLQETYLKVILTRREQKQGAIANPQTKSPAKSLLLSILFVTLLRPMKMLFTEPIVAALSLYIAFNFAVLFTFFGSIPYVYETVYHFNRGDTGLVFLAIGLGCTFAIPTLIICDKIFYQKEYQKLQGRGLLYIVPPEQRLWGSMLGAFGLPIGLFCFAWSSRSDVHWIIPTIAIVPFGWGNLCIYISGCLYLVDTYAALTAASAIAATGFLRYILGGLFPLFTLQMYEHLGIGWATSVLAFVSLAMLPIPWLLYKWGPKIRARSKFETQNISE